MEPASEHPLAPETVHYRDRAGQFFQAMQLLGTDPRNYGNSAAVLGVHCAISLADAVLVHRTGSRSRAERHLSAADMLVRLCQAAQIDPSGIAHLRKVLDRKNYLEYGDQRLDLDRDIRGVIIRVERFVAWALRCFPELGGGGI